LLGDGWRGQIAPSQSTQEYVKRLREVCFDWPGGFIAHSYTRYLGDLSGGQIIKKAVRKALGDKGISFYDFPQIPDYNAFKTEYRALLDNVSWNDGEQQRVIAEAVLAYQLNTKVLAELGRDLVLPRSSG
jgi:heme oxygenase